MQSRRTSVREAEYVVEKAVLLVPHVLVRCADAVHSVGDPGVMLNELVGDILVHGIVLAQDESHLEHALAIKRHPRRSVGLFQRSACRKLRAAVEYANVVQPEKSARKNVPAGGVLAVHPPI